MNASNPDSALESNESFLSLWLSFANAIEFDDPEVRMISRENLLMGHIVLPTIFPFSSLYENANFVT